MNDAKELIKRGDQLLNKRTSLLSLHQEIAENFYPERADFTVNRNLGNTFADNLMTSYPIIARRDLGNSLGSMLRPSSKEWMHITTDREDREDNQAKRWLEWATGIQRRAMYDRRAMFTRATKEGDHDFASFGQCAISISYNRDYTGLLYRTWHLRDVAWCENADGEIDEVHRKWKPTARVLNALFKGAVHQKVKESSDKTPYREVDCRHIVVPADTYNSEKKFNAPYVSIFVDVENNHIMEETGSQHKVYCIPRFQTVSGSQYAYSPATVAALPDARLIQDMTRVLLEAGEKATNPPMIAVEESVRSDVNIYAGGITWVDSEYDERTGGALRAIDQRINGIPLGMEMREETRHMIAEAFYLNTLNLPQMTGGATAFEIGQRVQEYIRNALPLFEPMEDSYNGALCEMSFDLLLNAGAFGSMQDLPQSLRGADIRFRFESPLQEAIARQDSQRFLEAKNLLAQAAEVDPGVVVNLDIHRSFRDALEGAGVPARWMREEDAVNALLQEQEAAKQVQADMAMTEQAAQTAEQVAMAAQVVDAA